MEDVSKFLWAFGYLIICSLQLIIPCFLGSLLSDKTNQLSFSLYESNWPDMSPMFKSSAMVIFETTKKPLIMYTTLNLFTISLPTFVSVSVIDYLIIFFRSVNVFFLLYTF